MIEEGKMEEGRNGGRDGGSPPPKPEVSSPLPVAFTQPCTIAQFTITSISDLDGEEGKR